MTPEAVKAAIIETLQKEADNLTGYTVFLFGSRATQSHHPRSDFDVGILGDEPLPTRIFYRLEDKFDQIKTLYTIDWVNLNNTSADFRAEALNQTEVLYEG
jgi:predicted nucleotidyltransferase